MTLAEAGKQDSISLKNGDTLTGEVINETISIKTSYATLKLNTSEIEKIIFEYGSNNIDALHLRTGDKLSGVIQDQQITLRLVGGNEMKIDRDKIRNICFRTVS